MKCRKFSILVLGIVGLGLAMDTAWGAQPAAKHETTLLLVPALPRVIQLAFDMAVLRPVTVVAWHGNAKTKEPVLHVWSGADWRYVNLPDFTYKTFLAGNVRKVIVIGDKRSVPPVLMDNMPWCTDVERLETINVTDLINDLDRSLKFRDKEWKWLADRYGLALTDLNAGLRNKNPFDIPRSKLPLEKREYKQEKGDLPPAELIENKLQETPAPATALAPAEKPPK